MLIVLQIVGSIRLDQERVWKCRQFKLLISDRNQKKSPKNEGPYFIVWIRWLTKINFDIGFKFCTNPYSGLYEIQSKRQVGRIANKTLPPEVTWPANLRHLPHAVKLQFINWPMIIIIGHSYQAFPDSVMGTFDGKAKRWVFCLHSVVPNRYANHLPD